MKKYSVLTFIFGEYELLREPLSVSDDCEYVAVTDNHNLTSDVWTIKYLPESYNAADGFTKSFYVRYHPFDFVSTDLCIIMDGSVLIKKSLDKLANDFNESNAEIGLMVHWAQINARNEYEYWLTQRGYSVAQAAKSIAFMDAIGYSPRYKGCFETGFKICKRDDANHRINSCVYNCLEHIGQDKLHIERVDQGIFTAVMNTKFTHIPVFPTTHTIIQNQYMQFCKHKTTEPIMCQVNWNNMYLFDKPVKVYQL